jgi:flavodoxin
MTRPARIAVVDYSATGNVHRLAHALAEGAGGEGAEVRIRHVEELASELIISKTSTGAGTGPALECRGDARSHDCRR